MKEIFVLDWFTNKTIRVLGQEDAPFDSLQAGDKVVYYLTDLKTNLKKESIGTYFSNGGVGERDGEFLRLLTGDEKKYFDDQQSFALKIFPVFKKAFKKEFPNSVPVTARFQIFSDQIYFFFYSEERYIFTDFVRNFREKLGKNMFLFQIGARDMIRMSPGCDALYCAGGVPLCCKTAMNLPSVEIENVILQNLEGRDIERLKGRCGKLKCCLIHELELYTEESKKYPQKGTRLSQCPGMDCGGMVSSFNIMTGDVIIKTEQGGILRVPLDQLKKGFEKYHAPHPGERRDTKNGYHKQNYSSRGQQK